jgi:carbon monoxide dehydrogenase subunit G
MEIRVSKNIAAPIQITFDVFSDIRKIEERIPGITKVEILSDIATGVGTRWRETRVMFGREATEEMEISTLKANQSYEVVAASNGMDYHTLYTFVEKDDGTQVEMIFTGKPVTLMAKLMTPLGYLFKNVALKALETDMDNLKVICENQAKA